MTYSTEPQPAPRAVLCCGCCVRQTAGRAGCQGLIANALPDVTAFLIAFPVTCVSMRLSETCNIERQTSLQAEIAHKSISSEECVRSSSARLPSPSKEGISLITLGSGVRMNSAHWHFLSLTFPVQVPCCFCMCAVCNCMYLPLFSAYQEECHIPILSILSPSVFLFSP